MSNKFSSIKFFIIIPKRERRWKYYINDNLQDSHSSTDEKLFLFISQFVKGSSIHLVQEYMKKYFSFIIDVENQNIVRIMPDLEKIKKVMFDNIRKKNFDTKKIIAQLTMEYKKENSSYFVKEDASFDDIEEENQTLNNRILGEEISKVYKKYQ